MRVVPGAGLVEVEFVPGGFEAVLDIRFVVTNLAFGPAEWLCKGLDCARGQAENLIELHKTQRASDRTSCRSALANQMRLVPHSDRCPARSGLRPLGRQGNRAVLICAMEGRDTSR